VTPDLVLVDELAHTNADCGRRRWEDVRDLVDAGLDVITTVNVANLASVREFAAAITGTGLVERVPDDLLHSGEVILVDLTPELLRQRILSGRLFGAEAVGGALANYFRSSNLAALSALGHAWMDGTVDVVGQALLAEHGILDRPPRPVVVAAVRGSATGEAVIRRATALAGDEDADLLLVHVRIADGLRQGGTDRLEQYRRGAADAGGSYTEVDAPSAAQGLASAARQAGARWVVVGGPGSRLRDLVGGSVARRLRRLLAGVDVIEVRPED